MEVNPVPLSAIEKKRLRAAIGQGKMDRETHEWKKRDRDELGPQLRKLLRAWQAMTEEARETVLEDVGHKLDAAVIRHGAFEEAISERLEMLEYHRPDLVPGLFEAVRELRQIWIQRGEETGGNAHRSIREDWRLHPMLDFMARAVLEELPESGGNSVYADQRLHTAAKQIENQLRRLADLPPEYR